MPEITSVGCSRLERFSTFDEPASRPSRTVWISFDSGKTRSSVGPASTVSLDISISPGLPSSSASGWKRS